MAQFQQQISAMYDDTYCTQYINWPLNIEIQFGIIVEDGKSPTVYRLDAFLRFLLNIPVGSTINSAFLTLHATKTRTDDFIAQITYTDEDDAADFSTNPHGRADGMTPLDWIVPDFTDCQTLDTIDIKDIIQHFINRAGYNANKHIAIRIKRGDAVGNEYQSFYPYDYDPPGQPPQGDYAAILTVNYTVVAPPVFGGGLNPIQMAKVILDLN